MGEETWNTIYNAYLGAIETIPIRYTEGMIVPFPGVPLVLGSQSDDVRLLQEYLNYIAQTYTEIPTVSVTGIYGTQTQEAVMAFQRLFDIPVTGTVLAVTWNAITSVYQDLYLGNRLNPGQYPGFPVGQS